MKNKSLKTVSMIIALLAITLLTSCGKDDKYNQPKEYTYYMNTSHMTLDEGAPCTLAQVAEEYKHYFDMGCDPNKYNNAVLQDIIVTTNRIQAKNGWTKFYHGYALIMCHHNSYPNENEPMYKFDYDTNTLTELDLK